MKGVVTRIGPNGMVAISRGGEYTVIEPTIGESIDVGDQFSWQTDSLGHDIYTNVTKGTRITVMVQDHCDLQVADRLLDGRD